MNRHRAIRIPSGYVASELEGDDDDDVLTIVLDTDSGDAPSIQLRLHADTADSLALLIQSHRGVPS